MVQNGLTRRAVTADHMSVHRSDDLTEEKHTLPQGAELQSCILTKSSDLRLCFVSMCCGTHTL